MLTRRSGAGNVLAEVKEHTPALLFLGIGPPEYIVTVGHPFYEHLWAEGYRDVMVIG